MLLGSSCVGGSLSLLRRGLLAAMVGLATLSSAQATDISQPSGSNSSAPASDIGRPTVSDNSIVFDNSPSWLCQGLPFSNTWKAVSLGAKLPAETKKCAATFYLGRQNDTGQEHMFGLKTFVSPQSYKMADSYFIGGSLSRVIGEIGKYVAFEAETGVGQRFGSLHEQEGWVALYARWKEFPWNDYLRTSVAVSTGLSYASAVPDYEVRESGNNQGQRLLHYLSPEITFGLPSTPDTDLVIRSHHRSGGGSFFGTNVPLYGSLFNGVTGGIQYINVGLRQHF